MVVINPAEKKQENRTSVHCMKFGQTNNITSNKKIAKQLNILQMVANSKRHNCGQFDEII